MDDEAPEALFNGKPLSRTFRKFTNKLPVATDAQQLISSSTENSSAPQSTLPYSDTLSVEICIQQPGLYDDTSEHNGIEFTGTRLPMLFFKSARSGRRQVLKSYQFGYSSLEISLVNALPAELRSMVWSQAFWNRTCEDDYLGGSIGLGRIKRHTVASYDDIESNADAASVNNIESHGDAASNRDANDDIASNDVIESNDDTNDDVASNDELAQIFIHNDPWSSGEDIPTDRSEWGNMKWDIYQNFNQAEYYELMAFAENLSEEDFQEFGRFFWENTILFFFEAFVDKPNEPGTFIYGGINWLNCSSRYHDSIENIQFTFSSPWQWGIGRTGGFSDGASQLMALCEQLSKLTNLQTLVFNVSDIEERYNEHSDMDEVLKRIAAGDEVDWVKAFRELPVKGSFEIWMPVIDEVDGRPTPKSGDLPKDKPDHGRLHKKYHSCLVELLTPNSVRKSQAPMSDQEKYLKSRQEWLSRPGGLEGPEGTI